MEDFLKLIQAAAKQIEAKGTAYEQLMIETFRKSADILDQLLMKQYSILSFVEPGKNPFAAENIVSRTHATVISLAKVRHVYWNKGNRLILGILPDEQGANFSVLWLSMHPTDTGITIYFGSDDNTIELPHEAWETNNSAASVSKLEEMLRKGLHILIDIMRSTRTATAYAYRKYSFHGRIKLKDQPDDTSLPSIPKAKNPIGFTLSE